MKNKPENNNFLSSGCLTLDTMQRHLNGSLSLPEKALTDEHLIGCGFCRDAMDGLNMVSDKADIDRRIREIKNIISRYNKEIPGIRRRTIPMNNRLFYVSAAASVIILLGLYVILNYYLPDQDTLPAIAETVIYEEPPLPPKPFRGERPADHSLSGTQILAEKEEMKAVEPAEAIKETHPPRKMASPANQELTVREQQLKIPESIGQTHDILELFTDNDQAEPFAGELNQFADIASAGPVEYFLSGITFFNDLPGYKSTEDQEKTDRYPAGTLTKAVSSKASGQTTTAAMDLPERFTDAGHIALEKEQIFDSAGIREHFFVLVDQMPQFPGGEAALATYLQTALRYPETARKAGVEGTVSVSFVIEENGQISSVRVHYGPGQGIDEETIRVISEMPPWLPALQDGIPVRAVLTMPVTFRLR
jgi:TonB family protein